MGASPIFLSPTLFFALTPTAAPYLAPKIIQVDNDKWDQLVILSSFLLSIRRLSLIYNHLSPISSCRGTLGGPRGAPGGQELRRAGAAPGGLPPDRAAPGGTPPGRGGTGESSRLLVGGRVDYEGEGRRREAASTGHSGHW